jgi:hypothetical protein
MRGANSRKEDSRMPNREMKIEKFTDCRMAYTWKVFVLYGAHVLAQ